MLCYLISFMGGIGSFSIFCVVGKRTPAILFLAIAFMLYSDNFILRFLRIKGEKQPKLQLIQQSGQIKDY